MITKRTSKTTLVVALGLLSIIGCGKDKKDDSDVDDSSDKPVSGGDPDSDDELVAPGAVLLTLDSAMGSIAFAGQEDGTTQNLVGSWTDEHCEEENNATKSDYDDQEDVVWGCLLSTKTNGPDTPRGGVNRVKQITCSIDKAIVDGSLVLDGSAHTFTAAIDDDCWGEAFAEMAAGEMPDSVNPDTGFVEIDLTVTAYTAIPAAWSSAADEWGHAFEIVFGFSADDTMTYKLLIKQDDNGVAAMILETEDGASNTFAMAITKTGGADDEHDFRYEGRFGYGQFGDGSYGSRHVRVKVTGPYAGGGGFSSITDGSGYEAGMWGSDETTVSNGKVSTFAANVDGLGARRWEVDAAAAASGEPSDYGVDGISSIDFSGNADELPAFLTTSVAAFTSATAWFKANGPLSYESVTISD